MTAAYPIQSYLFAHLVNVFTLTGNQLVKQGNFWSLMFFVLALAVAFAYFVMGWTTKLISVVVSTTYRQEYITNILRKRIIFFDREGRSPGTLTARMSTDATQIQAGAILDKLLQRVKSALDPLGIMNPGKVL